MPRKNLSDPAFPFVMSQNEEVTTCDGLTRHEYVTAILLQGLLAKHGSNASSATNDKLVDEAVRLAKKLMQITM